MLVARMPFNPLCSWKKAQSPRLDREVEDDVSFGQSLLLGIIGLSVLAFVIWASVFRIDQVARAVGEVIAKSRIQVIQAVDGGVLSDLYVREGDRVEAGQLIARLDPARIGAAVREIEARLAALEAKATRLRAEVIGADELIFSEAVQGFPELARVERALFTQRIVGHAATVQNLVVAVRLAREELVLVEQLDKSGDVNRTEKIRTEKALNEAEAQLINKKNQYLEDLRIELATVEDEIAQSEQKLAQRRQQMADSQFRSRVPGLVKNIRVTTVGGVLGAGEELMQIVPVNDELLVEAKIRPADISMVRVGQKATLRFDPFDYTIYGSVVGEVVYVSPDTLKEQSSSGEEIYYRAHIALASQSPVRTTAGRELEILPGMTAQVDIRSGDRTVMNYLLKPLRKTLAESLGEL